MTATYYINKTWNKCIPWQPATCQKKKIRISTLHNQISFSYFKLLTKFFAQVQPQIFESVQKNEISSVQDFPIHSISWVYQKIKNKMIIIFRVYLIKIDWLEITLQSLLTYCYDLVSIQGWLVVLLNYYFYDSVFSQGWLIREINFSVKWRPALYKLVHLGIIIATITAVSVVRRRRNDQRRDGCY